MRRAHRGQLGEAALWLTMQGWRCAEDHILRLGLTLLDHQSVRAAVASPTG